MLETALQPKLMQQCASHLRCGYLEDGDKPATTQLFAVTIIVSKSSPICL